MWKKILYFAFLGGFLRGCVVETAKVYDDSMAPHVFSGDVVLVYKLSYGFRVPGSGTMIFEWQTPRKDDLVVIGDSGDPPGNFLRQVKGLPGEVIRDPKGVDHPIEPGMFYVAPIHPSDDQAKDFAQFLVPRKVIVGKVNRLFIPAPLNSSLEDRFDLNSLKKSRRILGSVL